MLLRADGTSIYLTQDIATAIKRHEDWPFDRLIYVVANEQRYHFQVLFRVLALLGHGWAAALHHLAYGMVNLPEGKMKSREGTVVDADDLLADLQELAVKEIREREREGEVEDLEETARRIALGALQLLSIEGLPVQGLRLQPGRVDLLQRATPAPTSSTPGRASPPCCASSRSGAGSSPPARSGRRCWRWPRSGSWSSRSATGPAWCGRRPRELSPALVGNHLIDLARTYSRYYHDHPVLHNDSADLVVTRIELARAVLAVLKSGLGLLGVPYLERM